MFFFIFLICNPIICFAQSAELKDAFNQLSNTLKDYEFESDNVHSINYEQYITKSIRISFKYPTLILAITEGYKSWGWTSDEKAKPGVHKIEIPINETSFEVLKGYYGNSAYLYISNPSGITYSINGKKELRESYEIWGSKLNVTKLCQELINLQSIVKTEKFVGSLGFSSFKKENNDIKSVPKKTKSGRYAE